MIILTKKNIPGKVSGIVTSLPIIGGITACGVFLLIVSIIGLIGAMRHHQVNIEYILGTYCIQVLKPGYLPSLF